MSILTMVAAASTILISSTALANLATAQTSKTKDDSASSASSSASKDYKDFQKCLSTAEDTKGYATKQEIKDCYNPLYGPPTNSATTSSDVSPSGQ